MTDLDSRKTVRPEVAVDRALGLWSRAVHVRSRTTHAVVRSVPWRTVAAVLRGLRRLTVAWWAWVRVRELDKAFAAQDEKDVKWWWLERSSTRRVRGVLSVLAFAAFTVAAVVALVTLGALVLAVPALIGAGGAGVAGRRPAELEGGRGRKKNRPSQDMVNEALRSAKVIKNDQSVRFVQPVQRASGAWETVIDLPPGIKASAAIAAKEALASAFGVDEWQLVLERVRGAGGHAGRLLLWCADEDPYGKPSGRWPLLDAESWDFWQPFLFGQDARGTTVLLGLVWSSLLVGAIPRMGKTFAARLAAAAATLDPYVQLIVADGKGGADWRPFELVAHRYIRGVRRPAVERLRDVLQGLVAEMNDRYDRLDSLPPEKVPESKVTPEITRDPTYGMPLILVSIDEIQRYLEHAEFGDEIAEALVELVKVGPAVGIMVLAATQRPDTKTFPSELRTVFGTRFALKVMDWQSSETILGSSTYKAGLNAAAFLRSHKGVGILLGADDESSASGEAVTVRTYLLDNVGLVAVCKRGRALREAAGTLTGDAISVDLTRSGTGPAVDPAALEDHGARPPVALSVVPREPTILDLVRTAMEGRDRTRSVDLCARLTELGLEVDPTRLAEMLEPFGVSPADMWIDGKSLRGYRLSDVLAALGEVS